MSRRVEDEDDGEEDDGGSRGWGKSRVGEVEEGGR